MLVYKLNQNIDAQKLIEQIQKLIQKTVSGPNEDFLLTIKIQEISYNDDSSILKLEHKIE